MDLTVLCFDRDLTVDVNFDVDRVQQIDGPADARPVPLSWVKHYAHAVDGVDVWATGNQRLRAEAAIPGLADAAEVWRSLYDRDIETVYESYGFVEEYKPRRRDGLRLIRDIYTEHAGADDSLAFTVVDDVDLSDMAHEWGEHYYAWDFVEDDDWAVDDPAYSDTPVNSSACSENVGPDHGGLDELRAAAE